jgi:group I intron endonuclease
MAITKAIEKYGPENFTIEEVYNTDNIEDLNIKESYFIKFYNTMSPNGYNLTSGGDNFFLSQETKDKISKATRGRKATEEQRKRLSESHMGYKVKEETKLKLSIINKSKTIGQHVRDISSIKNSKCYILGDGSDIYVIKNMKKFAKANKHCKANLSNLVTGKKLKYKNMVLLQDFGYIKNTNEIDRLISNYLNSLDESFNIKYFL